MINRTLFGQETELALFAVSPGGARLSPADSASLLLERAVAELPHLGNEAGGLYLATGGRLYRDTGDHPEITTPEVTTPWDGVRYVRASERILCRLAKSAKANRRVGDLRIFKHNANYGTGGSTAWGTHESYNLSDPDSGRGGDRQRPGIRSQADSVSRQPDHLHRFRGLQQPLPGIEFLISPRVAHLACAISSSSTSERPILHLREESLSRNSLHYRRLHLICGESNLGDLSLWLKFATTALVAAMLSAGIPLPDVQLARPVRAMGRFARDVRHKTEVQTRSGESLTVLDIQRAFLEAAQAAVGHPALPPWSADACLQWRSALEELERRPILASGDARAEPERLDWRIKHALFSRVIRDHRSSWAKIRAWNRVVRVMQRAFRETAPTEAPPYLALALWVGNDPRLRRAIDAASPLVAKSGLHRDGFRDFLRLRDHLQELDIKLMELGDESLFAQLDRAGVFDHQVEGVASTEDAGNHPPAGSRAAIRGKMIRTLHQAKLGHRFSCGWEGIYDRQKNRTLDLGDPFETRARWVKSAPRRDRFETLFAFLNATDEAASSRHPFPSGSLLECYDAGDYRGGWQLLEDHLCQVSAPDHSISPSLLPNEYYRFRAWFAARQGLLAETFEALAQLRASNSSDVANHVLALSNIGLTGDDSIEPWIEAGMRATSSPDAAFLSNAACRRLRTGDTAQAQEWLDRALQPPAFSSAHAHTQARILAHRGECCRRMGDCGAAGDWLHRAGEQYIQGGFRGDYADFCLTYLAKLAITNGNSSGALHFLDQALAIQSELGNPGQLRTLLLMARARRDTGLAVRDAVAQRAQEFPSWAACPRLSRILESDPWTRWSEGGADEWMGHAI